MFEEEFFVPIMPNYQPSGSDGQISASETPLVYKYHSELSPENAQAMKADMSGIP